MTHEPECPIKTLEPTYITEEGMRACVCQCRYLRAAYRRGYNDHAAAAQHWQDTHGAYRQHGAECAVAREPGLASAYLFCRCGES